MLTLTVPFETALHRILAGFKLGSLAIATLILVPQTNLVLLAGAALITAAIYLSQGPRFALYGLKMLRPLWPFLLILTVWHWWSSDVPRGFGIAIKMLTAVALANLVTMTTRLDDMIALVERLAAPLAKLGLPPRILAVAIALVIRFTPVLMDKTGQLVQAWRARSHRRANWRLVLPATLMALDDADHVAEALRARGGL